MLRPPRSTRTETRFPCTTLFRSDTAAVRVAWLTLERDDRDLKRFVNYLLRELQRNGTDDDAWGASSDLPPRAALSAIINALGDTPAPVVLSLDDLHHAFSEPVGPFLESLVRLAPSNCHFLFASRDSTGCASCRARVCQAG